MRESQSATAYTAFTTTIFGDTYIVKREREKRVGKIPHSLSVVVFCVGLTHPRSLRVGQNTTLHSYFYLFLLLS